MVVWPALLPHVCDLQRLFAQFQLMPRLRMRLCCEISHLHSAPHPLHLHHASLSASITFHLPCSRSRCSTRLLMPTMGNLHISLRMHYAVSTSPTLRFAPL